MIAGVNKPEDKEKAVKFLSRLVDLARLPAKPQPTLPTATSGATPATHLRPI
ncbi:MAG: hypothetical protein ACLFQX_12620 [Candidatus Kapaibacterium sp.]